MVIHHLHGCDTRHTETVPVHETFRGKTAWEGEVEVFDVLKGHPRATKAYGWLYQENGTMKAAAILGIPPVNTPLDAVKVFIISEAKKK
jgi:hypothetical protein